MKILKFTALVLLVSLFASCGSGMQNLSKGAEEIAKYCGTSDVKVGTAMARNINGEDVDAYTIEISNVKVLEEGYPVILLASHCAKILYDTLDDEQRQDNNTIRVIVNSASKSETNDFKIADIKRITPFIKKGHDIVNHIKIADYKALHATLDTTFITNESYTSLVKDVFEQKKDILSKTDKIEDDGFEFITVNGKKFINVFSHTPIDSLNVNYKLTFTDTKSSKLAGFLVR